MSDPQDLWPTATTPQKAQEIIDLIRTQLAERRKARENIEERIGRAIEDINRLKRLACLKGWEIK